MFGNLLVFIYSSNGWHIKIWRNFIQGLSFGIPS